MTAGLVLGIDTATGVAVGIARDGEIIASEAVADRQAHAEQLMPLVSGTLHALNLTPSDLDAVAVGMGPGPFTGLRVGIVTAHTLASVLDIPLLRVGTLDVLAVAAAAATDGEFLTVVDARRRELYWARYDGDGVRLDGPHVSAPTGLPALPAFGPAAELYPLAGPRVVMDMDAGLLAAHAGVLPDPGPEPLYLRRPDATAPTRHKSTLLPRRPR